MRLMITTHSGDADEVDVEDYDADELNTTLNDSDVLTVCLGGNIYSRIDIKSVKPAEDVGED